MLAPAKTRPGLSLEGNVVTGARGQRHEVPRPLLEPVASAIASGVATDEAAARWLEARHLVASERVERVEAWAAALAGPPPAGAPPVVVTPASRFTCHGCGLCCRSYVAGPISASERAAILERREALAPHVPAPVEAWLSPRADGATWVLGRTKEGACVFLDADGLCRIHKHAGVEAKPFVCRRFPLFVTKRPDATLVSLRIECETFARSHDDGAALESERAWVERVAAEETRPLVVPSVVRLLGDVFVPLPVAQAVEARALRILEKAPTVQDALLAIREVALATLSVLGPAPGEELLERALAVATEAPLAVLREVRGPGDPARGREALRVLLDALLEAAPRFLAARALQPGVLGGEDGALLPDGAVGRENDRLAVDAIALLRAAGTARHGWPGTSSIEAPAVAAVDPATRDPAILGFLRECHRQVVSGSRPLAAAPGLVYGLAHLAVLHLFATSAARLVASRRGAARASRDDWNHAIAVLDRSLRLLDISSASPVVVAAWADLAAEDLG